MKILKTKKESTLRKQLVMGCGAALVCALGVIEPAYADWFQVGNIKAALITPVYTLVNESLGYIAFAVGGIVTFLSRGQDMYQKGMAFAIGSLGTAGAVKLAQTVLHLG